MVVHIREINARTAAKRKAQELGEEEPGPTPSSTGNRPIFNFGQPGQSTSIGGDPSKRQRTEEEPPDITHNFKGGYEDELKREKQAVQEAVKEANEKAALERDQAVRKAVQEAKEAAALEREQAVKEAVRKAKEANEKAATKRIEVLSDEQHSEIVQNLKAFQPLLSEAEETNVVDFLWAKTLHGKSGFWEFSPAAKKNIGKLLTSIGQQEEEEKLASANETDNTTKPKRRKTIKAGKKK